MVEYNGEIFEVQTLRPDQYEYQWVIPKYVGSEPKLKYVVSKSRKLGNNLYFRNHEYICGCMDWRSRRQQLHPPLDRCKHIRAVIRQFGDQLSVSKKTINVFGHVTQIKSINEISMYNGYGPIIRFSSNWSGKNVIYTHILEIPVGSLAINIDDLGGNSFCGGYISNNVAFLAISDIEVNSFGASNFFGKLSETQFTSKESEQYQAMQEQYERWAAQKMEIINQSFVFDGLFSDKDKEELAMLKKSKMISDFRIVGSSLILDLKDRAIIQNKKKVWEGDYKILIGKFNSFYAIGRNIRANRYNRSNIHPHISPMGTPCLASYGQQIAKALSMRKWVVFAGIINDFLTQYNPRSPYVHL